MSIKPVHATSSAAHSFLSTDLRAFVEKRGIDTLSGLKMLPTNEVSETMLKAANKIAEVLGERSGEELNVYTFKIGSQTITAVTDCDYEHDKELVGFFDKSGQELGRAWIFNADDAGMSMAWANGDRIGTLPKKEDVPQSLKKAVAKYVDEKSKEDMEMGEEIEVADMPDAVRQRYEHMNRTIADATGAERFELNGKTIYALHDYSCVASAYFYTAAGTRLYFIEG